MRPQGCIIVMSGPHILIIFEGFCDFGAVAIKARTKAFKQRLELIHKPFNPRRRRPASLGDAAEDAAYTPSQPRDQ